MKSPVVFQNYSKYTEEDHQTWSTLAKRQRKLLSPGISREYLTGFEKLELDENRVINIPEMSERLKTLSGWSLAPVEGLIPPKDFFLMLLDKVYPVTIFIRKPAELDFSEQPDMFHDIYGHLPLLINEKFTKFLSTYSAIAYKYANNERAMELMARLYWFTYEMGVIKEDGQYKPYGGAIITSVEESNNLFIKKDEILPFELTDIFNTAFNPYELQKQYFVIDSFDDLFKSLENVEATLLKSLAADADSEEHKLLVDFNDTKAEMPAGETVVSLFRAQATKTPEATAVISNGEQLSYQELEESSNQLARLLLAKGVKEEVLVPLCMERSVEFIVGVLGIMKAGGVYVPLDPTLPSERIKFMLQDSNAGVIVTSSKHSSLLSVKEEVQLVEFDQDWMLMQLEDKKVLPQPITPEQLAYVIYTSGTTGKPKGVMVEHAGLVNLCLDHIREFSMSEADNYLQFMSTSFDGAILDIFCTLLSGATLVLPGRDVLTNSHEFIDFVERNKVTIFTITPSFLSILEKAELPGVRTIISAGEAAIVEDAIYYAGFKNFYNGYGPSEVTVNATLFKVTDPQKFGGYKSIPIGKPRSNKRIYILNNEGGLCSLGTAGEIYISGAGLARGYLNRPELTAEKFIIDPFGEEAGLRMYRTGDVGRWLEDGNIEYLGRLDDQVKLNGYRIELTEIESVLQQSALLRQAVVLCSDRHGSKQLIAYVVPVGQFDKAAIVSYVAERVPHYMVPAAWVSLESLPLNQNGKIDKKALSNINTVDTTSDYYDAPSNEAEKLLTEIWQELLNIEKVGVKDNFFELGGHSLMVLQLVNKVRKLGINIDAKELFAHQTIKLQSAFMAKSLKLLNAASEGKLVLPIQPEGDGIPLFAIPEFLLYSRIGAHISKNQPLYSMERSPFVDRKEAVAHYISEMKRVYPEGPYCLAGYCEWGDIAIDMATSLIAAGDEVPALILIECYSEKANIPRTSLKFLKPKAKLVYNSWKALPSFSEKKQLLKNELSYIMRHINKKAGATFRKKKEDGPVAQYPGKVILIRASETFWVDNDPLMGWSGHFSGPVNSYSIEGEHLGIMVGESSSAAIAKILNAELAQINNSKGLAQIPGDGSVEMHY